MGRVKNALFSSGFDGIYTGTGLRPQLFVVDKNIAIGFVTDPVNLRRGENQMYGYGIVGTIVIILVVLWLMNRV